MSAIADLLTGVSYLAAGVVGNLPISVRKAASQFPIDNIPSLTIIHPPPGEFEIEAGFGGFSNVKYEIVFMLFYKGNSNFSTEFDTIDAAREAIRLAVCKTEVPNTTVWDFAYNPRPFFDPTALKSGADVSAFSVTYTMTEERD